MGILKALLRTTTAPIEITVRTIKGTIESCSSDTYTGNVPLIGDFIEAIGDTSSAIIDEFEE